MGLSRNKVAVSEGAAGSPPFYGEQRSGATAQDQKILGRTKNGYDHGIRLKKKVTQRNDFKL